MLAPASGAEVRGVLAAGVLDGGVVVQGGGLAKDNFEAVDNRSVGEVVTA